MGIEVETLFNKYRKIRSIVLGDVLVSLFHALLIRYFISGESVLLRELYKSQG
jgi:hypothetical protein